MNRIYTDVHQMQNGFMQKYFRSYTIIDENGQIYNRIIGMYWNKKSEVWENTDSNGWYHFTAFMPYTN